MAWHVRGEFFENCSCDAICPCTWSNGGRSATLDYCRVSLAFRIDEGDINDVDVSNRTVVLIADTPPNMLDGNWKVGLVIDDGASDEQAQAIGEMMSGSLGGPPGALGGLIGEFLGVERLPVEIESTDGGYAVTIGSDSRYSATRMLAMSGDPVSLSGISIHPAGETVQVAVADESSVSVHGIEWSGTGLSGLTGPFSWAA